MAWLILALLWAAPAWGETFTVEFVETASILVPDETGTLVEEPIADLLGTAMYRKLTGEKDWTFVRLITASSPAGGATRSEPLELPLKPQDTWTIWVKLCSVRTNGEMTPDANCWVGRKLRRGTP